MNLFNSSDDGTIKARAEAGEKAKSSHSKPEKERQAIKARTDDALFELELKKLSEQDYDY